MISLIKNYFVTSYQEMRKVVWPNRQEVTSHTIIVILSIIISMAIIAALDFGLFNLIQYFIYNQS